MDDRAAETVRNEMTTTAVSVTLDIEEGVLQSREGYVSGTPVFTGTRVPIKNLFDYLANGHDIDEFLSGFPSVTREQAVGALSIARNVLESIAYETAAR